MCTIESVIKVNSHQTYFLLTQRENRRKTRSTRARFPYRIIDKNLVFSYKVCLPTNCKILNSERWFFLIELSKQIFFFDFKKEVLQLVKKFDPKKRFRGKFHKNRFVWKIKKYPGSFIVFAAGWLRKRYEKCIKVEVQHFEQLHHWEFQCYSGLCHCFKIIFVF